MTKTPDFVIAQAAQRERTRLQAIDIAVERFVEAEAAFKLEIIQIHRCYDAFEDPNFVYMPTRKADANQITADPTVAQYV